MVDRYLRQSPLAHLSLAARAAAEAGTEAGVVLAERAFRGLVNLRGDAADPAFLAAVAAVVGQPPPVESNRVAGPDDLGAGPRLLWLGPSEWLAVTEADGGSALAAALASSLAGRHGAVTDVSESRVVIAISGPEARRALSKGMIIDLHPRAFATGHCAQSLCGRADVIAHCLGDGTDDTPLLYEVYGLRSFAEYLWAWLEDAAGEYGVRVEEA